ncbi:MAG TPA: hypothetical protein DCL54_10310 [Alphaproteobacteria bacterium]|nr:hypothetical protein [Alphaproteobacteria bacterium]
MIRLLALILFVFASNAQAATHEDLLASIPPEKQIVFNAYNGRSLLGTHKLFFDVQGNTIKVRTEIDLKFKVLFVTAYTYEMRTEETWTNGQFVSFTSSADDNGEKESVSMTRQGAVSRINGSGFKGEVSEVLYPTSYWAYPALKTTGWMSTQSGKIQRVAVKPRGTESLKSGAAAVQANRYDVSGDLNMSLWFNGRVWTGARFKVSDNNILYVRQ